MTGKPDEAAPIKDEGDFNEAEPFKGLVAESYTDGKRDEPVKDKEPKDDAGATEDDSEDGGESGESGEAEDDSESEDDEAGEGEEEGEGESDDGESEDDDAEQDEDVDQPAPKKTVSARIAELTKARREAEDRAEAAERELAASKKRGKAAGEGDEEGLTEGEEEAKASKRPDPKDYEFGEIDPEFVSDMVDWRVDQKLAARDQKQSETQQQEADAQVAREFKTDVDKVYSVGQKAYKDFKAKVIDTADKGQWDLAPATALLISKSKVGHHVVYHLATNRSVAAEIAKLDPLDQARRFGRLEARYLAKAKEKTAPKPPKAKPMPNQPRGAGGKFGTSPDTPDFNAFEKLAKDTFRIDD